MSWRYNKDKDGFTDEAIEAVEQELKTLAEKIQVTEEELGERIADRTFRQSFDFIEEELIMMRSTAIDVVIERTKKMIARIDGNHMPKLGSIYLGCACAGIAIVQLVRGLLRGILPVNDIYASLSWIAIFLMLWFTSVNFQAVDGWLLNEVRIDLDLSDELMKSAKELVPVPSRGS